MPPRITAIWFLALAFSLLPRTLWSASACDLNNDGQVNVIDVQLGIAQAFGISSCTNGDLSQDGQCGIVDVQRLVNAALGQECLIGSGAPPPALEPWERSFTTLRTHYVSTSGTGNGDIGTPESFATARGHAIAGDLHIMRAGTYAGVFNTTNVGTAANPIVWRGYIDANGDPENVYIDGQWRLSGAWQWLWAMRHGDTDSSATTSEHSAIQLQAPGTAVINSVIKGQCDGSGIDTFNFGSGMVVYGVTMIDNQNQCFTDASAHHIYAHNVHAQYGWKYFIQNIHLDQPNCPQPPCRIAQGPNLFNNGWSNGAGTAGRGSGIHIQDSMFQLGRFVAAQHTGFTVGNPPMHHYRLHQNWHDTGLETAWVRFGLAVPAQIQMTDNLFRNTRIQFEEMGYWGAGDACYTYPENSIFTGNEIYDPPGNEYIRLRVSNFNASCGRNANGAAKIRDADAWNNNTYGRTSGTGTFSLFANGSGPTSHNFAAWKTATDAARETAGGTAFDAASTETTTPTTDRVQCFDNFYQPGWGYCRAIDWDGNGSITIPGAEADKIVGNGKTYKVRNVRDFHGTPLKSGTHTTGADITSITLPGDAVNGVLLVWITSQP